MKKLLYISILCFFSIALQAQMWNGVDTLYGNEWIDYDAQYLKISVAEDGIYRVPSSLLQSHIPGSVTANQLHLYYMGELVPIYLSTEGTLGNDDFIEFFGRRNRNELDNYLLDDPENHFHPDYSFFTDSSAYFLTWKTTENPARIMDIGNDITNAPPKEEYFMDDYILQITGSFTKKSVQIGNADVQQSFYSDTEGWGSGYSGGPLRDFDLFIKEAYTDGPDAECTVQFACRIGNHHQVVRFNGTQYVEDIFSGFVGRKHTFNVPISEVTNPSLIEFEGLENNSDKQSVSYVQLRYPHTFKFNGEEARVFTVEGNGNTQYIEVPNFNSGASLPRAYDVTNGYRLTVIKEGGIIKFVLPPATGPRQLALVNVAIGIQEIESVQPVNFIDFTQQDAQFVIIYNQFLNQNYNGSNWVEAYANYRQNESPMPMTTALAEIQQLYDQFAYGINRHSISIRNFSHFIKKEWSDVQYFFLIGKGREYRSIRKPDELEEAVNINFFLPTFGVPGADNLLFSPVNDPVPYVPIGRLAATTPSDVKLYLDKVKSFENPGLANQSIEDQAWKKRVVHLGGGGDAFEQQLIRGHLDGMATIIENNIFGGEVTSFYKTSTDPIETSQTSAIKDIINSGVAILTFFGHSSPNIFDFNFDDPATYDNIGKYPILFSMGCFSGQCHTDAFGIGERFIKAEDRGAIAYFASTGYGFISALDVFGDKYYQLLGGDLYGESIGTILLETIKFMSTSTVVGERELAQQTTLQGDPSLLLYPRPGPDYLPDNSSVQFDPPLLNTQLDSFSFIFDIANIGQHLPGETFVVEIEQELPNGERIPLATETVLTPAFSETLRYNIPILGPEVIGFNRFHVKVDAAEEIEEAPAAAELNNELVDGSGQLGFPVFIVSNDVRPMMPNDFGIVNTTNVELIASTLNATAEEQSYIIEIDTTELFNSSFKQSKTLTQIGGLLKWQPNLNLESETVYYWRVSPDSTNAESGYRWQSSSFVHLPNSSEGWNQSHYYQLLDNNFINMEISPATRKLDYIDNVIDIKIRNVVYEGPARIPRYYRGSDSQVEYQGSAMTNTVPAGVMVAVLDSVDILPMTNPGGSVFGDDYGFNGMNGFLFKTNSTAERAELINFLENEVDDGYYVIFFTVQRDEAQSYLPEEWALDSVSLGTNLFQVLEAQGAELVRDLEDLGSFPYSLLYRKNEPTFEVGELIGPLTSFSEVNAGLPGNWISGRMNSVLIGPATEWSTLSWNYSDYTDPIDSIGLTIYGVKEDGSESQLQTGLLDASVDLASYNNNNYPFMRLEFFTQDEEDKTSTHLDHWRINYKGLPEAALNLAEEFEFYKDTLQQGETLNLVAGIENISAYDMDSLLVRFTLLDASNEPTIIEQRMAPLLSGNALSAKLEVDTRDLTGAYSLTIDVNPDEDQLELTHINNVGLLNFYVVKDNRNPLLDVTFDGTHIMDGELVSPQPNIVISLTDDNPYLELADTSLFRVMFVYPNGTERQVFFQDENVQFFPATSTQNNRAKIEIQSNFTQQDGQYKLFIEAQDASGNQSGDLNYMVSNSTFGFDYQISFEVINQSMISNILNYPNPFSTSTRFVYTLTGSEPPSFFKIQIMTVSGRIVRELTQADLGMLRPGTHRTDFAWDGTDAFGDPLANGVYLYRIVAQKANGEDFETYETGADSYFKKGFGKMVIVR